MIKKDKELILCVEDESVIRNLMPRVFNPLGVNVELAKDYEHGMAALRGEQGFSGLEKYTGLILDMRFKGHVAGHELAKYAIQNNFQVFRYPIIIFSGGDLEEARKETGHLMGIHLLQKPVSLAKLVATYTDNRLAEDLRSSEWFGREVGGA